MDTLSVPLALEFPRSDSDNRSRPALEFRFAGRRWETTAAFTSYWYFAAERQEIFFRRLDRSPLCTTDPILQTFKFTNAYRASDRVSQYLIRHVIYGGDQHPEQLFFRVILFKLFNKIDTWKALSSSIPHFSWRPGILPEVDALLSERLRMGCTIYSGAYIMPSGGKEFTRKHRARLSLLDKMMNERVWKQIASASSMKAAFDILLSQPMLGSFLAYHASEGAALSLEILGTFKQPVLIEEFVPGREVSFNSIETRPAKLWSYSEIVVAGEPHYFDDHLFEAEEKRYRRLERTVRSIDDELNTEDRNRLEVLIDLIQPYGYCRIDGKHSGGQFVFLEITPDAWIAPRGALAASFINKGMLYSEVIASVLASAPPKPRGL